MEELSRRGVARGDARAKEREELRHACDLEVEQEVGDDDEHHGRAEPFDRP